MMIPGPGFWAIIVSAILLLVAGVAGYISSPHVDTISQMITSSERTQNGFSLVVGIIIVCQLGFGFVMYRRLKRVTRHVYVLGAGTVLGFAMFIGGAAGFTVNSTDLSASTHTTFAGVSFAGMYLYLLTFAYVSWHSTFGGVLWPDGALAFLCVPVICGIVWLATGMSSSHDYVYEFVFLGAMFGAACSVFVTAASVKLGAHLWQPLSPRQESVSFTDTDGDRSTLVLLQGRLQWWGNGRMLAKDVHMLEYDDRTGRVTANGGQVSATLPAAVRATVVGPLRQLAERAARCTYNGLLRL